MTYTSQHEVNLMKQKNIVPISKLKATLSAVLAEVRRGVQYTVLDRTTPIALLSALQGSGLVISRPAKRKFRAPPPSTIEFAGDPLEHLMKHK